MTFLCTPWCVHSQIHVQFQKKIKKQINIQHSVQANLQRTKNVPAFGVRGDKQFQVFFNGDDCHIVGDIDMDHMDTP